MCGVIAYYGNMDNPEPIMKQLFYESRIRGRHATGISYIDSKGIMITNNSPIESHYFIDAISFNEIDLSKGIIGHTRYSTSDLEYNQPIVYDDFSISHNGVITQENADKWENDFGYKCSTKNDSELIIREFVENKEVIRFWNESSIAAAVLHKSGEIIFFRNGYRPLWFFEFKGSYFISSTEDIMKRAFRKVYSIEIYPTKCVSGVIYSFDDYRLSYYESQLSEGDIQIGLECSANYRRV